jgi:hypothetical protein
MGKSAKVSAKKGEEVLFACFGAFLPEWIECIASYYMTLTLDSCGNGKYYGRSVAFHLL